jgi:glycogen debranching enzyme
MTTTTTTAYRSPVGHGLTFHEESAPIAPDTVTVLSGTTFALSWPSGDLDTNAPLGLFCEDSRLLSRWILEIDGIRPQPLTHVVADPWRVRFVGRVIHDPLRLLVERDRRVDAAMREDIVVQNLDAEPVSFTARVHVGVDFASLFAVKENRVGEPPPVNASVTEGSLVLSRAEGSVHHQPAAVVITAPGCKAEADSLVFRVDLGGRATWRATVHVRPAPDGRPPARVDPADLREAQRISRRQWRGWEGRAARLMSSDSALTATLTRSRTDLGSLRIFDPYGTGRDKGPPIVAAGSPWFMTLFGRDSLLASYMTLALDPSLAEGVLAALAGRQGRAVVAATEEEPGRILHEVRFRRGDHLEHGGRDIYYGTADATPLFVALVGEYARWHGRSPVVERLLPAVDRALAWIDDYGDRDGDGFVEYHRMTPEGLVNQGWKDSWDGITFADGTVAQSPIALCEVQGYVYAAFRARAMLADLYDDPATAQHWVHRARQLKRAFNERFWIPERGWLALGLDHEKRPIDALASNMGQALWTGIVSRQHARAVAEWLLSPTMFTGWGIRTLASSMGAYDPLSYHNGSVWPHDTALIAYGLMRHGLVRAAQHVAVGLLDAAAAVGGRLPELFAGLERSQFPTPVPYPTACSPQAWASAAPVHLVRTLLGLEPELAAAQLSVHPHVPPSCGTVTLSGLALGGGRIDIVASGTHAEVSGLPPPLKRVVETSSSRKPGSSALRSG